VTVVDGLTSVPLSMLAGGTTGAYRFELVVSDADGNVLFRDSWERKVSTRAAAYVQTDDSSLLESFRFGVRPGNYDLEIRVYPTDAADLGIREEIVLSAFVERPVASDLVLSTRVEPLDSSGEGSWSLSRGGFGINAVARTVILSAEPELYYYLELYGADTDDSVSVTAEVIDAQGRSLFRTPPDVVEVPVGGRAYTGRLPVGGLPAGHYRLQMAVEGREAGTLVRAAPFEFRDAMPDGRLVSESRSELEEYFDSLSDEELERTFGGVAVLVTQSERRTFEALPPDAKRRYLVDYFDSRDPNGEQAGNAFLNEYLDRIATISARYGERVGTGERLPWTTDMGKLYLRLGEPADRIVNYSPASGSDPMQLGGGGGASGEPPYEIWQYQTTGFVYLFIEQNQFNAWKMIFTTDPNMTSLADWYRRIGSECGRDLTTNFGIVPGG
jgi:GWxTD domain-containing protein